jgi:SAM-dependent methyltransferase
VSGGYGHETVEYWEHIYAGDSVGWSIDPLLPSIVAGLEPGAALDIGCGEGQNGQFLAERGWSVVGIDVSPTAIERARERALGGVRFEVADARSWEPGGGFDLVVSIYALPPAGKGRREVLSTAARAVAPGGTVYVAEFDESTTDLWPPEDLVSVDELTSAFDGFALERAEVVGMTHFHDDHVKEWPMAILVAQRSD